MDGIIALKKAKSYTDLAQLGLTDISVNGTDITLTKTDGSTATVTVPTPKDGTSVTNVALNDNKLTISLSDGTEIVTDEIRTIRGDAGESAYEIAVKKGFKGSESEWLTSLQGNDGKSAYEIALDNGFEGIEEEWLKSLKGEDGDGVHYAEFSINEDGELIFSGSENSNVDYSLTNGELIVTLKDGATENLGRVNGWSAYEVALKNGFKGTEEEWLESLKGSGGSNDYILTENDKTQIANIAVGIVDSSLVSLLGNGVIE